MSPSTHFKQAWLSKCMIDYSAYISNKIILTSYFFNVVKYKFNELIEAWTFILLPYQVLLISAFQGANEI